MAETTRCQACGTEDFAWTVRQAEFHVGALQHYKLQLCRACTQRIAQAIVNALPTPQRGAGETGEGR